MAVSYIALGSNLGDPEANVQQAIQLLAGLGKITKQSRLYRTAPWGVLDQPEFVNAVIQLETDLSPRQLLERTQDIEKQMGRETTYKWGPRLIDLDILTYDDMQVNEPDLTIPHPYMKERSFVMIPLQEIDPDFPS